MTLCPKGERGCWLDLHCIN
uniref:Uncharacterized protein n=1 Tax=Anguilla anguilla TaxID=7936 RepID=A0A0E9PVX6_ANGAN